MANEDNERELLMRGDTLTKLLQTITHATHMATQCFAHTETIGIQAGSEISCDISWFGFWGELCQNKANSIGFEPGAVMPLLIKSITISLQKNINR